MYTNFLTASEREVLLALLSDEAPDYILLRACESTVEEQKNMREDMRNISKSRGINPTKLMLGLPQDEPLSTTVKSPKLNVVEATNVEPPGDAAARITPQSREVILQRLTESPATPAVINRDIKGKTENTSRLLKRLWVLGEVTFDGTLYHPK